MDIGANASLRATALCAPEITAVVLTFHHAIADALSGIWVLQDMMRALAGEQLDAFRSFPPPIEERILGSSLSPAHASEADRIMRISPEIRSAAPIVPDDLRTNIVAAEFSQEETARLIERCRANDTTVHGAICAAASRHAASDRDTVRMICPIDLRKIAGIENGICGVFIGASSVELPIGGNHIDLGGCPSYRAQHNPVPIAEGRDCSHEPDVG
jgi:hypothetical protein